MGILSRGILCIGEEKLPEVGPAAEFPEDVVRCEGESESLR